MERQEVYDVVYNYMCEQLAVDDITADQDLNEFSNFDSMLLVEVILYLEETFHIEIPEDDYDIERFDTLNKIVEIILNSTQVDEKPEDQAEQT